MANWWWPWPCFRPPGSVWVGALQANGEGGTVQVGPSIGGGGGGGPGAAVSEIRFSTATGDFSVASVMYGVAISGVGAQAQPAVPATPAKASPAPSPQVVSSQTACTYTFRPVATVSERGSHHGQRQRKRRDSGTG